MDPQLPRDVLSVWIGRRAADTFVILRARWLPSAYKRWLEVAELTAPTISIGTLPFMFRLLT